jgi:quercetin dioxygenase-like cupin family protein
MLNASPLQTRSRFYRGARNKMHIHSSDQVLFVTAGKGIIATEADHEVIDVGDVVHILRISPWHLGQISWSVSITFLMK